MENLNIFAALHRQSSPHSPRMIYEHRSTINSKNWWWTSEEPGSSGSVLPWVQSILQAKLRIYLTEIYLWMIFLHRIKIKRLWKRFQVVVKFRIQIHHIQGRLYLKFIRTVWKYKRSTTDKLIYVYKYWAKIYGWCWRRKKIIEKYSSHK